jgi:hypothetical protein
MQLIPGCLFKENKLIQERPFVETSSCVTYQQAAEPVLLSSSVECATDIKQNTPTCVSASSPNAVKHVPVVCSITRYQSSLFTKRQLINGDCLISKCILVFRNQEIKGGEVGNGEYFVISLTPLTIIPLNANINPLLQNFTYTSQF